MKLFEINQQMHDILSASVNEDGEIDEQAFALIDALQIAENEKIEGVALYCQNLLAESAAIKDKAKSMTDRAKAKETRAASLKGYLTYYLQLIGKSKFETPLIALSFRKSVKTEIADEQTIIDFAEKHIEMGLIKTTTEVSKTAVANAIKSGIDIPGARLVESQNLQMK